MQGATINDVKVAINGQRSAGTVYLLKAKTVTINVDTTANNLVTAFDAGDETKYIAKLDVAKTAGEAVFTGVITEIENGTRTDGDVFAAVFVSS